MPNAYQTIAGFFTAGAAGLGVATPAPGDTFAVPSFSLSSKAYLEQVYGDAANGSWVRIRSARMHDANQGIRLRLGTTPLRELLPWGADQVLYPSDTPTVEIDENAVGTGGILLQYGFDDLPGVQPRLASWEEVQPRIVQISGVEVAVTSGAIGAWGNGVAINSSFDNFEAGADYALLGYQSEVQCLGIAVTGKDTGNLKVGGPGAADVVQTSDYFVAMSHNTGRPRIPVIAANNKGATLVQNVDVAAGTVSQVTLVFAQLA